MKEVKYIDEYTRDVSWKGKKGARQTLNIAIIQEINITQKNKEYTIYTHSHIYVYIYDTYIHDMYIRALLSHDSLLISVQYPYT